MIAHKHKKIGVPKQPKPSKRARTTIADGNADFQGKINIQNGLRAIVPLSPKVAQYPALGTTFDAWSATTDKAAVLYKTIIETEATLEQLFGSLGTIMGQYSLDRASFLLAAQMACPTADEAKALGLSTIAERKSLVAGAPVTLNFIFGDVAGDLTTRWSRVPGAGAYVGEQSVDPPTEESWEQCYMGKSPSFKLTGLPVGEKLWFRIRSVGKTPSAWSAPAFVVTR